MSQRKLNLVLALADGDMTALHRAFNRLGNHLDRKEFTKTLSKHCPSIAALIASGVNGTNVVDHLFFHVDMNGDGYVSWDDLFDYAVGTANERLQRLPAERTRSYTFSRFFPRQDNVLFSSYFQEPDLLLLSSRHVPVQLLRPETMEPIQTFHPEDVGGIGVLPVCSTYLGASETLAIAFNDMRLRLWSSMDKEVATAAHPLRLEHMVTTLRAIPTISSSFIMGCDNGGNILTFEASRHALGEPRVRSSLHLHSREMGGVSDFCLMRPQESRIVTAGYDRQLLWTDVTAQRSTLVGVSPCVLRHVEYFEAHQCVIAVGHDNMVSSWVTHQSQKPCTKFEDPSRPHGSHVIGVVCVPNTPQVLTCDASGMVKVWDMRNFRCAQTFHAAEGFNSEAESGMCKPLDDHEMGSVVNAFSYLEGTREACAIVSSGVHMHMYDKGAQPQLAAHTPLNCIRFNPLSQTIMTLASTAVQVWDSELGHLQSELPKTCKEDMTTMSLDGVGRRMFIGTQGGDVEVRSCDGGTTLEVHKMHRGEVTAVVYSAPHRALLSVGMDGFLALLQESDNVGPPQRQKLSHRSILCMCLAPELGLIAAGGKNGSAYVMDVLPPRNEDSELKHNHQASAGEQVAVHCVGFLGAFPLLAVGYENGDVLVWSVRPLKESLVVLALNVAKRCEWNLGMVAHPSSLAVPKMKRCESEAPQPLAGSTLPSVSIAASSLSTHPQPTAMQQYHNNAMTDKLLASVLGRPLDDGSLNASVNAAPAAVRPTCLAFDRSSHHFFVANSKGQIQVWAMCPFLQAVELPTCSFPSSPLISIQSKLNAIQKGRVPNWRPSLVCSIQAHRDEIVDIQVIPSLDLLASCGDDQRVLLFDMYGNRLAELSQGRIPDFDSLGNVALGSSQEESGEQRQQEAHASSSAPGESPTVPTTTTLAPRKPASTPQSGGIRGGSAGSSRKSRRPTVDRMLRQIHDPVVSDDPREYKPADGHTIDTFDIQESSPSRQANNAARGGTASEFTAAPSSSKYRRKSSMLSHSVMQALTSAAPEQAGVLCGHERCTTLPDNVTLRLPRRAISNGPSSNAPESPRSKREPEVSIAPGELAAPRLHGSASPSPGPPDGPLDDRGSRDLSDSAVSSGDDEPLLPTFDLFGDEPQRPTADSSSAADRKAPKATAGRKLSAVAALVIAKTHLKTSISSPVRPDPRHHMAVHRRRFSARLKPMYPPIADDAQSNEKHLVTLLRNLEEARDDWLTDAMKRKIAEYVPSDDGVRADEEGSGAEDAIRAELRDSLASPTGQADAKDASPLRSRLSSRPPTTDKRSQTHSRKSKDAPDLLKKRDDQNVSGAASSVDDIQWTTSAAEAVKCTDTRHPPLDREASIKPPASSVDSVPQELATDADLPPPSAVNAGDPAESTAAASSTTHNRNVAGGESQHKIHDWLISTGKHHPQVRLSNETKLVVPTTMTPIETLKLLHDAWQLAHSSGGTALHYLGIAGSGGSEPGSPKGRQPGTRDGHQPTSARSTTDDHRWEKEDGSPTRLPTRGSLRSAGGVSNGTRCSTGNPIHVGIAKLTETSAADGGSPTKRCGGQLVLYGPKKGHGGEDDAEYPQDVAEVFRSPIKDTKRNLDVCRPSSQRSPRGALTRMPNASDAQLVAHQNSPLLLTQTVGIHRSTSPRAQSSNVYTSHVRHGHVPLGRGGPLKLSRPPGRPDAKTARIALLEEELKRCLARKPPPEAPSWL